MAGIDPVQFGQMIESIKALSDDVHALTTRFETMERKVNDLSDLRHRGIGLVFGLMFSGGAVGAWLTDLWSKMK